MRLRAALALSLSCFCLGSACAEAPETKQDPRAVAVFERTKHPSADYAVYQWNWARRSDGEPWGGWSVEFHRGSLHRVELPLVRAVANCTTGAGSIFHVAEGRMEQSETIGNGLCGINSNSDIKRLEWVGRRDSRFGPADLIRVIGEEYQRSYAVSPAGILLGTEYFRQNPASGDCVQNEAIAVEEVPAGDIFSAELLRRSIVDEKFRTPPAAAAGTLWLSTQRCE